MRQLARHVILSLLLILPLTAMAEPSLLKVPGQALDDVRNLQKAYERLSSALRSGRCQTHAYQHLKQTLITTLVVHPGWQGKTLQYVNPSKNITLIVSLPLVQRHLTLFQSVCEHSDAGQAAKKRPKRLSTAQPARTADKSHDTSRDSQTARPTTSQHAPDHSSAEKAHHKTATTNGRDTAKQDKAAEQKPAGKPSDDLEKKAAKNTLSKSQTPEPDHEARNKQVKAQGHTTIARMSPADVYLRYLKTLRHADTLKAIVPFSLQPREQTLSQLAALSKQERQQRLNTAQANAPTHVQILSEHIEGKHARVRFKGRVNWNNNASKEQREMAWGTVNMTRRDGTWRIGHISLRDSKPEWAQADQNR